MGPQYKGHLPVADLMDALLLKLIEDLRECCAFRAHCDPPDHEAHARYMARLAAVRDTQPREAVLRLETLIEKLTGVKR
jgi:hypothetical protein